MAAAYRLQYTVGALRYLEVLTQKIRGQVVRKIEELITNPFPANCKKLVGVSDGEDPVYRLRSGDYRILYVVRGNPSAILVLDIDHRKDVYR